MVKRTAPVDVTPVTLSALAFTTFTPAAPVTARALKALPSLVSVMAALPPLSVAVPAADTAPLCVMPGAVRFRAPFTVELSSVSDVLLASVVSPALSEIAPANVLPLLVRLTVLPAPLLSIEVLPVTWKYPPWVVSSAMAPPVVTMLRLPGTVSPPLFQNALRAPTRLSAAMLTGAAVANVRVALPPPI